MFLSHILRLKRGLTLAFFCSVSLSVSSTDLPSLPEAVSNNAVAKVSTRQGDYLLSFMGLAEGKTYRDVHNKVWALKLGGSGGSQSLNEWQPKSPVPSSLPLKGRLASIAVGIGDQAYIFGGYTVDKDHREISSPDNFAYQLEADSYRKIANTPVPVDDTTALVYQSRYIYLISGWHNDGNVNLVQLYDTQTDTWQQATPFPGVPVFGHAGGIVDESMLVCDGVKVQAREKQRRTFLAEPACYLGTVDSADPTKIDWRIVKHPTGVARYRMAATGVAGSKQIIFYGGSDNPYNYNGIGYNSLPAEPSEQRWLFDLNSFTWNMQQLLWPSMDHRGMLLIGLKGRLRGVTVGGMGKQQRILSEVRLIPVQ